MSPPLEVAIGAKALQLPSGVGVSPVRTLSCDAGPGRRVGVPAERAPVGTLAGAASKTRESKAPERRIGAQIRSQSTASSGPPAVKSLAATHWSGGPKVPVWVATRLPST